MEIYFKDEEQIVCVIKNLLDLRWPELLKKKIPECTPRRRTRSKSRAAFYEGQTANRGTHISSTIPAVFHSVWQRIYISNHTIGAISKGQPEKVTFSAKGICILDVF